MVEVLRFVSKYFITAINCLTYFLFVQFSYKMGFSPLTISKLRIRLTRRSYKFEIVYDRKTSTVINEEIRYLGGSGTSVDQQCRTKIRLPQTLYT